MKQNEKCVYNFRRSMLRPMEQLAYGCVLQMPEAGGPIRLQLIFVDP
jgi:hypothetical protein